MKDDIAVGHLLDLFIHCCFQTNSGGFEIVRFFSGSGKRDCFVFCMGIILFSG